jgi:photosystem II stability/assembly factor-like uncharacterized protein
MTFRKLLVLFPVCLIAAFWQSGEITSQPVAVREAAYFNTLPARCIGPATFGGRITEVAVVESNPAIMYAAAATGGLWKTEDNGTSWAPVFDQATSLCMGAVAVAPSNPDIVWVGTGEGNILRSVSIGDGVYRSTDGGKTWDHMGLKDTRHISRIVIHPKNPDIVYIAALGHAWGQNADRGVFKTTDGGKTWEKALYIDDTTGATDLAMDPNEPDILYVCAYTFRRDPFSGSTPRTEYGTNAGIYKTTDAGKNWTHLKNGLPDRPHGRCGLSVYRKDPNTVFAIVQTDKSRGFGGGKGGGKGGAKKEGAKEENNGGIYRSDDKGKTWTHVSSFFPSADIGFYFGQIRVDPNDDQRVYVLAVQLSISTDGGKTFANFGSGHADNHALWINPKNSEHVVLGNDGGLFFSHDKGKSWQISPGLPTGQFYGIAVDMRKPYRVYGGLQDNGSWGGPSATYNNVGITLKDWYRVGGGDGFYCQVDPTDPDTVYCEMQMGGLQRVNLKAKGGGMGGGGGKGGIRPKGGDYRFNWNSPILISPHDPKTVFFAGQYLFKSADRGDKWDKISPDLTHGGVARDTGHTITTIAESPLRAGLLWVGTDDGRLHVSKNGGQDWLEVTSHVPVLAKETGWITRVECSHFAEGTAYLTVDRHRNDDLRPFAYKTTDFGTTWNPITGDLPKEGNLHCIRESSKNVDLLFVGTEFGLYGTLNGGKHWHRMKTGLPPAVLVHDLLIHPRERELVVGTHGRSIYVVDIGPLEELTPNVLASDMHLFDVRPAIAFKVKHVEAGEGAKGFVGPNPPYGATICYLLQGAAPEPVTVTILDKEGKTVVALKGEQQPGLHKVVWNLRAADGRDELVAPGDYAARLQIGERKLTKPIRVEAPE